MVKPSAEKLDENTRLEKEAGGCEAAARHTRRPGSGQGMCSGLLSSSNLILIIPSRLSETRRHDGGDEEF
jgi:hypothetical protein